MLEKKKGGWAVVVLVLPGKGGKRKERRHVGLSPLLEREKRERRVMY